MWIAREQQTMAYLNESERDKLLHDLTKMNFNQARRKLRGMDQKGKLRIFRTVQNVNEWWTSYDLVGLGTSVTLIEQRVDKWEGSPDDRDQAKYELERVIVTPMPGNRT